MQKQYQRILKAALGLCLNALFQVHGIDDACNKRLAARLRAVTAGESILCTSEYIT